MCLKALLVTNAIRMGMNKLVTFLLILFCAVSTAVKGQSEHAILTYQSAQHLYLKMNVGTQTLDSLQVNGSWLKVIATSSSSVVVENRGLDLENGTTISILRPTITPAEPVEEETFNEVVAVTTEVEPVSAEIKKVTAKREYRARIGSDYYASFGDGSSMQRLAERFSVHLNQYSEDFGLSVSSRGISRQYLDQGSTSNRWNLYELQSRLEYKKTALQLGRSVPRYAASLGALDGLTATVNLPLRLHVFSGYRPDYKSFGIDRSAGMFGVFVETPKPLGTMNFTSSLGWSSMNGVDSQGIKGIDRQLIYHQMSLEFTKRLSLYHALEIDTYQKLDGSVAETIFRPTGWYTSLNFRATDKTRFFLSYDTRAPRVFFQQFDAELEQLLFNLGIQQGLRLRYNQRLNSVMSLGAQLTWRSQSNTATPFVMGSANVRIASPFSTYGSFYGSVSVANNSSYSTQVVQMQYRDQWNERLRYRTYLRYLNYDYPGSSQAQSARFYSGVEASRTWKSIEGFTRIEASVRNASLYPGIQLGLTYRIKSQS